MPAFQIDPERCRNCLKCMQECPVTAIRLLEHAVAIDPERCVACGVCRKACGHGAVIQEDQRPVVKGLIAAGRKVILSVDPACRALLPERVTMEQLAAATQKLGVWDVADAAEAAAAVASEYARILREKSGGNLILSACPVVQNLVEQYYPELIASLSPVASTMIAHGRMLKRDFTSAAVIYVTTCPARAAEAEDVRHSTEINGVLTIEQVLSWLREAGIDPAACEEEPLLSDGGGVGTLSAMSGGMLTCIRHFLPGANYQMLQADGIERCMALLEELQQGNLDGYVLELFACPGGCVGRTKPKSIIKARQTLEAHVKADGDTPYFDTRGIALANPAIARAVSDYIPTEDDIQAMLYHIGVGNPRQQQNCGACGYETCRMRAEAILRQQENVSLCRQVVQEAKQDVFSVVYENLPLAAVLVDETQKVVGFNGEAGSLFSIRPEQEKYIFELMDPGDFQYVLDTGLPIKNRRMDISEIYMRVEASLVPLKDLHMVLGLFRDITEEEEAEAKQQQSRLQSVEMAQKVIEKQMTVAQQIAFLLGETTAETKVTLNQLKQRILGEEEEP